MSDSSQKKRRVVVTGIGLLSPAGSSLKAYWEGLTCGRSAIKNITLFDTSEMPVHSGGEVEQEELQAAFPGTKLERTDRTVLLGLAAAQHALADADVKDAARNGLHVGVVVGTGLGPCHDAEWAYGAYSAQGWSGIRPTTIPRVMFNAVASQISIHCHLTGGHHVVAAACASSSLAMAEAFERVQSGRENIILTGGADSPMTPSLYGAWVNLRVLSKNPNPMLASKPFDRNRDGLVLSEGAAMLLFEEAEHARARGAKIYAEIIGYGTSSDATHITKPDADGQAMAIRRALESSGLAPMEVDYINAHGTSTILNDPTETKAIKQALGDHARQVPISSTKSVIGHAMGASGALELVATILAFQHQVVPPTVNLHEPDPECDLDYVPNLPRVARLRVALSNSFAFGGSNCVLAIRAFEES